LSLFTSAYLILLYDDVTGWTDYVNNGYSNTSVLGSEMILAESDLPGMGWGWGFNPNNFFDPTSQFELL